MKLIQLNIFGGVLSTSLVGFLANQQADILTLQEVVSSPTGQSFYFDALQEVLESTQLPHTYYSPTWESRFGDRPIYFGNAILSKLKQVSQYHKFVANAYQTNFDFQTHTHNIRNFQHVELKDDAGRIVHILNYHGYRAGKSGNEITAGICQIIADYAASLKGPKIIAGDFNLCPESSSLRPLNKLFQNLCIEQGISTTRNQFARSLVTVDYIWVSEDIIVNRFEVLPDLVSDHAALLLEFDIS